MSNLTIYLEKTKKAIPVFYILLFFSLSLFNCQPGKSLTNQYGSWSFSGYVIDGSTQLPLSNVNIRYLDQDGAENEIVTDNSGKFFISSLPFGDRSFKFTHTPSGKDSTEYTQKIIVASSYNESRSIDGLLGDVSKVITLYPLTGSVSGEIYLKLSGSQKAIAAGNVNVKITYSDTNMSNSTPIDFECTTDTTGYFRLVNLPMAPGANLKVNNYLLNNVTYACDPVSVSQLFKSKTVPMDRIYLIVKDTTQMLLSQVRSNVLSTDGFGIQGVPVNERLWYALPQIPVPSSVNVIFSGGGNPNPVISTKHDTVFISHDKFSNDSLITVTINFLDSAGNHFEFKFDGVRQFRTEKLVTSQVKSNVLSSDGYGLTGVPVNAVLWYSLPVYPQKSNLEVLINGSFDSNTVVSVKGDTVFINPGEHLPYDTLVTVSLTGLDTSGKHIEFKFDGTRSFKTERKTLPGIKSNVLSESGFGLSDIKVDAKLWYILPVVPVPSSITISLMGGGSPTCDSKVNKDTVFIDPQSDFKYNSLVTVVIKGTDTTGSNIEYTLDGAKQFRTEKNVVALESNTWRTSGSAQKYFQLNDTIWVKYSEPLDKDINKIDWAKSSAMYSIFGSGPTTNADVWVKSDTLFVKPDQRLAISYGQTMGFKVSVTSSTGKRSDTLDVVANIISDGYYTKWTNTKDYLGNMRQDFGTLDSVIVVSNAPIEKVVGISGKLGNAAPSDLSLDNVHLRGDTIIYKPSLYLKPDSTYGLDFDILFKDGNLRYNVLGVTWKTALKVQILSYDNRESGVFRQFRLTGDSLTVKFSLPIDTGANASIPFKVNMVDVRYRSLKTRIKWDNTCTVATIFNLDTLPSADFDASPAYSVDAINTRAVKSVSFDLVTKSGEQVLGFKPKNEDIELHTEKGLCVVDANILLNHDNRNRVDRGENAIDNFPLNGSVRITFNRTLDTASMKADTAGLSKYAGIKTGSNNISSTVTFSSDGKSLIITPDNNLSASTSYYVWLKNVSGMGIASAPAINKDSGIFSGKSSNYSLLDDAFQAK